MDVIISTLVSFVVSVIDNAGYAGIFLLMTLEGSFLPVPSEIILPFSGFLVSEGRFSLWIVALIGAVANIVGTMITYSLSRYVGLPFLYKYGRYVLVTRHDIDMAHRLFARFGAPIVFVSRLIPGIRGFVPIPAGVAEMSIPRFVTYVFVGSFLWSLFLTYVGVLIGENWEVVQEYIKPIEIILFILVIMGAAWWIYRHVKIIKREQKEDYNV